jgi:hypothetical protein
MLIEFRIKNFRSFRDQQVLSMVAANDKELRDSNTFETRAFKMGLVRSAVVYGPNASGKSNLIMAMGFLQLFMLTAVNSPPAVGQRAIDTHLLQPFLLNNDTRQAPIEFELTFVQHDIRYEYGLTLDRERIYEEWLIAFPKGQPQVWFERMGLPESDTWYFGPRLAGEKQRLADITRSDVPFLAVGATFGNAQLRTVFEWFAAQLAVFNPWGNPDLIGKTAHRAAENPQLHQQIRALLAEADFAINDFAVQLIPVGEDPLFSRLPTELLNAMSSGGFQRTEIRMRHQAPETTEGYVELPSQDESLGTQRFFAITDPIVTALELGQVLAIDEIDDSLHPLLVRRLVELFHSQETNPRCAQLIMNTHDTTMLDTRLFRRDQIWFTERDGRGGSQLYPLSSYSPRKDESLAKGYLHGRYGAVPNLLELGSTLRLKEASSAPNSNRKLNDAQTTQ